MSDFATDTFTDTDGTIITSHSPELGGPWSVLLGTATNVTIQTNRLYQSVTEEFVAVMSGASNVADCSVQGSMYHGTGVNNGAGVMARVNSDASNGYLALIDATGSPVVRLYKKVSGTFTQLGTDVAITFNTSDTKPLQLNCVGTTISVDFDSVTGIISVTDSAISSAGKVAVRFSTTGGGTSEGIQFDEFHAFVGGGGSLIVSDPVVTSITNSAINLAIGITGGNAPVTQQWYRATSSGFTPGGGNILTGKTATTLSDTTAIAGTAYFYKAVVTDSSGTPVVVTTFQSIQKLGFSMVNAAFIGDSITNGGGGVVTVPPYTLVSEQYPQEFGQYLTAFNYAVNGTKTADWVSGQAAMTAAIAGIASNSLTTCVVTLGTNDAITGVSSTTYASNLANIVSTLLGAGITKLILNYPTGTSPAYVGATDAMVNAIFSYQPKIDAIVNGTTVLQGDQFATATLLNNPTIYITNIDSAATHLTVLGNQVLSNYWTGAINRALNKTSGGGGTTTGILYASLRGRF